MLNDSEIIIRAKRQSLITPFNEKLLQPHSYDCTLAQKIKIARYDSTQNERYWEEVDCYVDEPIMLQHGEFALGSTAEYFKIPQDIVGFVQGKSSVGRNGLQIENAGLIDAGFEGAITLEFYNMAPWPIALKVGMSICQVHFTEVSRPVFKNYSVTGHYNKQEGPTPAVYAL